MSASDAAALREIAAAEEAAFTAAQLYIRVLQSRELLALADENLAALKVIAKLIASNVQNGNATQADTQRVDARCSTRIRRAPTSSWNSSPRPRGSSAPSI